MLLTPLALGQATVATLIAFAFGIFAYKKQIGGWGHAGVVAMAVIAMNICRGNDLVVAGILTGAVGGVIVGVIAEARGYIHLSVGRRWAPRAAALGAAGFDDVQFASDEDLFGGADFAGARASDAGASSRTEDFDPFPAATGKDQYAVLGVDRTASAAELKRAYHALLKTCHPDLFPGDAQMEARAKEVNEAYAILSDDQKRAAYDRYGAV